jgi:hypothetical protein
VHMKKHLLVFFMPQHVASGRSGTCMLQFASASAAMSVNTGRYCYAPDPPLLCLTFSLTQAKTCGTSTTSCALVIR